MATKLREIGTSKERHIRKVNDIKSDYNAYKAKRIYTNEFIFRELAFKYYLSEVTIERYVYMTNFKKKE